MHTQVTQRDAWLELTTSNEFDVTLLADGGIARRQFVEDAREATVLIRSWLDDGCCLQPLDELPYGKRCFLKDGHKGGAEHDPRPQAQDARRP